MRNPHSLFALFERHPLAVGIAGLCVGLICAVLALDSLAPAVAHYF